MKVYEKINRYLETHGIDRKYLAKKSRIPYDVLCMKLNGEKTLFADELREICIALDIRPEEFI